MPTITLPCTTPHLPPRGRGHRRPGLGTACARTAGRRAAGRVSGADRVCVGAAARPGSPGAGGADVAGAGRERAGGGGVAWAGGPDGGGLDKVSRWLRLAVVDTEDARF